MKAQFAKIALAALALSAAGAASAVSVAAGPNASTQSYTAASPAQYVVTDFQFTVSANTALESVENTVAIAVQTANTKGRNNFSGISDGGSVTACGDPTTGAAIPAVRAPTLANPNGCTP